MSGYRLPPAAGEWITRDAPLRFSFNGETIDAYEGDTVASALLAQGIVHVGRSFKLHRPRGIFSAGVEEPTGLLDVGTGAERTPNTRATDIAARDRLVTATGNAWPSLRFDLAALSARFSSMLPAGFYYKTFMWPHWNWFEPTIRRMAGLGRAADGPDPARYDQVSRRVELLVVGAGAAGMQAALSAARAGQKVLLMEGAAQVGGWLAGQGLSSDDAAVSRIETLRRELLDAGVELRTRCTVFGLYDHLLAAAVEVVGPDGADAVRERLWTIRAQRIVLATGAFERPMLFPDNDRPGVMLASAGVRYARLFGVACGRRVVVVAACDSAYGVADSLVDAGVNVVAIVERRQHCELKPSSGVRVIGGSVVAVAGGRAVRAVTVATHDGGPLQRLDADCVASAGGWAPAVQLHSMAGGKLRWIDEASMFVPASAPLGIVSVGACAGAFDLDRALEHAAEVGRGGSALAPVGGLGHIPADTTPSAAAFAALGRAPGKTFVDLQNDVASSDIELAARENYHSVEHLKRYTTLGMATDQGKTSNVNGLVLMGRYTGRSPAEVGTTKFRPPFKPVTLNTLAGGHSGERLRPLRRMPGHAWHVERGGAFEDFGGWWRPAAYPHASESLTGAAEREALQVRTSVGLFEGSPLGKIEVYGPDAACFLDLMYVGTMSTLAVGQARYGVLLDENGVVYDDGIVARLGEHHFWVNTTSGGAERVALAFEEWLQCEYIGYRVLITPVTSSWGNVTVAGPRAWALLEAAGFDLDLSPAVMPHMSIRESANGSATLRVLRASFSGELGYEINLPATRMPALLERLWSAGQAHGVTAYGVEALMLLRTEKGFLHIGGDTDGTTLPGDVGLDRGVAKKTANFVGRRSLLRPAALDPDRMQLVGLVPVDRQTRLPVGAHIADTPPPAAIDGVITSSVYSPTLGHPVALAMLRRGRQRLGESVTAYHLGRPVAAEVVKTPFFDPSGTRLNG